LETVAIAIWGTLLAFIVAIPLSMFAAKNTLELMVQGDGAWQRMVRWFGQFAVRRVLDFCRGFNEFVMALIFVAVIGLGPYAGVLALAIHTFGILGKVFSEAIEQIEPGQVEAVTASGAGPAQIMAFSVIPQVMPLIVSYTLLRFESNVRSATILGFVGAGGIGFLMFDKINGYLYREVCTMMIMVILSVTVIDYLCGMLRRRFV
jgi:phosphonate transport system permease protein